MATPRIDPAGFHNPALFRQAVTHRSAENLPHNERLEFLGDAILNTTIAEALYRVEPPIAEGAMSRMRAQLVCRETLAEIAREVGMGPHLVLGPTEEHDKGRYKPSILADALEAYLAAVRIDRDLATAQGLILAWWGERLQPAALARLVKDPKTQLQEWLQGQGRPLPEYRIEQPGGSDHKPLCRASVWIDGAEVAQATAGSKRNAQQEAARLALELIEGHS